MFRSRHRTEAPSAPTAQRGAVGSARVWDERTRADRAAPLRPRAAPATPSPELRLSPTALAGLVRGIVHAALEARLPDCPDARREPLARELELRLLELFEPRPVPPPEPPSTPPSTASPEPAAAPHARPKEEIAAPGTEAEPRARLLDLALEDRLGRLGSPLAARADLRDRLVALALRRLEQASPEPNASPEDLRSLDVLQRRAAKLEQGLTEARAALSYVTGLEHVDAGVASIYRCVQGLPPEDPRRAQKGAVLECIFRANLSLQKPGSQPG